MKGNKGQVGAFVIVAIAIVVIVGVYIIVMKSAKQENVPSELAQVIDSYDSCIKEQAENALSLAGAQGGKIDSGEYVPGSEYAPFSSHLNFQGIPVSYWYYLSGNGVIKEQVPTKVEIENEIAEYLNDKIKGCDFSYYRDRGYQIQQDDLKSKVVIEESKVKIDVNGDFAVEKEGSSANVERRSVELSSMFGKMYREAREIYEKEKRDAFLENYSIDVLRSYAPVDGVEIKCSPKIWKGSDVVKEINDGLEANLGALNFGKGTGKENDYFFVPVNIESNARVLYSSRWPWKIEIHGADNGLLIAEPNGNQQGMGIIGFCYAPYHFVYDMSFPVMVQVHSGNEIFQFPVAVVIDKNVPRKAEFSEYGAESGEDVCESMTQDIKVNIYDASLKKVNADIAFQCFDQKCELGKSENGTFIGKAPACVNGYIEARAEGYSPARELFSSNEEREKDLIIDKEYEVKPEIRVGGKALSGSAILTLEGKKVITAALPEQERIKVSEGLYNITVYVYGNSSVKLPESKKRECKEVSSPGIAGLFGATKEVCIDITIPETNIDYALSGGGKGQAYIFPEMLEKGKIVISAEALERPESIEQLQNNFASFELLKAEVEE